MAQHDYVIDNQLFPATLDDLNAAFQAIVTQNSGPTAPLVYSAGTPWYDTVNQELKRRNDTNTAWESVVVTDLTAGQIAAIKEELGELALLDQVTATEIANLSINSNHLNNGAVVADKVPDGALPLAKLASIAADTFVGRTGSSGTPTAIACTEAGRALLDDADAEAQRTTLGLGSGAPLILSGTGSPEGVVTAPVGWLYLRTDGTTSRILYNKASGTGNTGWQAMGSLAIVGPSVVSAVRSDGSPTTLDPSRPGYVSTTISDNTVLTITLDKAVLGGTLDIVTSSKVLGSASYQYRTQASRFTQVRIGQGSGGSLYDALDDTVLTGTFGTNGRITVSTNENIIYIENRATTALFNITLIGS
jgi:hypothetical protein